MRLSRSVSLRVSTIIVMTVAGPWLSGGMAQEAGANGQSGPNITGTGVADHIALWKTTSTLRNLLPLKPAASFPLSTCIG